MDEAQTLERTLWRRALALAGDESVAEAALGDVLLAHADPRKLAGPRRDRLLVQGVRAARAGRTRAAAVGTTPTSADASGWRSGLGEGGAQLLAALDALERPQREAWVLRELEQMEEIDAARALDCSRTAMGRFLDEGRAALGPLLGEAYPHAVTALRAALDRADPAPALRGVSARLRRARRTRRLVSAVKLLALLACMGVLAWVGWDLLKTGERERERQRLGEQYSLPAPSAVPPPPLPTPGSAP